MRFEIIMGVVLLVVLVSSCAPVSDGVEVAVEKQCMQDSDCVANSCCHAKDAVHTQYAPDCQSVMCTMSCEPDTLDCGQGKGGCVSGECRVVMKEE